MNKNQQKQRQSALRNGVAYHGVGWAKLADRPSLSPRGEKPCYEGRLACIFPGNCIRNTPFFTKPRVTKRQLEEKETKS